MGLTQEQITHLNNMCRKFRSDVIDVLHEKGTGHPGGSLSVCEILTTLYFAKANVSPEVANDAARDRIVLTKGHAAPMLYRVLAEKGFFPVAEMSTLRDLGTRLQGHPSSKELPGVELSTGPLGIGLSASLGMALGQKLSGVKARVYSILGDGEINEGTVWEACMSAAKFKADNLTAILDYNRVQLDGTTDEVMPLGDVRAKFEAFGWHCVECDGHDVSSIYNALEEAEGVADKPSMVIAHTVKGKGISFMEGKNAWHGKPINDEEYRLAKEELGGGERG